MDSIQDKIRGCLIGGATGDALGYPVEFLTIEQIKKLYGENGIQSYRLGYNGKALISDDTQMTLFTATGLLTGVTYNKFFKSARKGLLSYVWYSYRVWYSMQRKRSGGDGFSWLNDVSELGLSRAPGNTCMESLRHNSYGSVNYPINESKGCGGVMRVAPVGLCLNRDGNDIANVVNTGAEVAALTHGHELGWLPSATLAYMINLISYQGKSIREAFEESVEAIRRHYHGRKHLNEFCTLMERASGMHTSTSNDLENIKQLGEGWTGDEALAIAVYCALKYPTDLSKAIQTAVNHSGDSDSTGAITGQIIGASIGYEAIPDKWKRNLELSDVIIEVADDLFKGAPLTLEGQDAWERKYVQMKRVAKTEQQEGELSE